MSRIYLRGDLYYADKAGVKPKLIEMEGTQTTQAKKRLLADILYSSRAGTRTR